MRKILRVMVHEFVYGGHLLSIGAACTVWSVAILANVTVEWTILFLAYLASQIVYNNDHVTEVDQNGNSLNVERTKYLSQTLNVRNIIMIIYVSLFLFTVYLAKSPVAFLILVIIIGGILYTLVVKRFTTVVVGLKNIYVAFFWSTLVFVVPLHYSLPLSDRLFISFALIVFIRWIVNSAYFDIKDLKGDKKLGLKTLPVVYGVPKTIRILHVFNMLAGLIVILFVFMEFLPDYALVMVIFTLYSLYYLSKTLKLKEESLRKISYLMVDSEYLFWPVALTIAKSVY